MHPVLEHGHPSTVPPVENDLRPRDDEPYLDFERRLMADIKARGVQVPLICYRKPDGSLGLIDGETRRRAALLAGVDSIPVLVYAEKPSPAALELGKLLANTMRLDLNTMERIGSYVGLMTGNGWCAAELSRHVHASPAQVAKDLGIHKNACDEVKALVASGKLSPRAAYAISRLPDHQQQIDLARKAVELPMAVETVEEHVAKLLGGKKKAKPVKARTARGLQAIIPALDCDSLLAELGVLVEAVKRLQKHGLPLSALPSLLKPA